MLRNNKNRIKTVFFTISCSNATSPPSGEICKISICFDSGSVLQQTHVLYFSSFRLIMANGDFQISSIIETSKCMGSEKITERRKSAETLDILLSNQNYIAILDDNTDASHGFTWNNVFDAAIAYMSKVILLKVYLKFTYSDFMLYRRWRNSSKMKQKEKYLVKLRRR